MRKVSDLTNICYFNYQTTGETEGHALMGFEFASTDARATFLERLSASRVSLITNAPPTVAKDFDT